MPDPAPPVAEAVTSTPDWSTLSAPVLCPLCDYDLRGLSEPRCPECGYRFEWPDLLDAERRRHPWLFEEQRRRLVSSFFKTWLAGLRPAKFWSSLRPSHPPRPARLLLYWFLTSALLVVGWGAVFGGQLLQAEFDRKADRQRWVQGVVAQWPLITATKGNPSGTPVNLAWVNTQAAINYPSLLSADGIQYILKGGSGFLAALAVVFLLWPMATFATLMIFKASMGRAKVRRIHVRRCVIYAGDFGLWFGLLLAVLLPAAPVLRFREMWLDPYVLITMAVGCLIALVTYWRLAAAYRLYLKFDHPRATVAASQVILLLVLFIVALNAAQVW